MSDTYTKLFSSITESTVWGESYPTRIVWVTMLAMADARGNVYGAVPGLARRANVTLQEVEAALAAFLAPDPYSRTQAGDGRRIEAIDGGWTLINHGKYAAVRNGDERKEYQRQWDREHRGNRPNNSKRTPDKPRQPPTDSDAPVPTSTNTSTNTKTEKQKPERSPNGSRLPDDWQPSDVDVAYAEREHPRIDWRREALKFRNYWLAKPGKEARKTDWHKTWCNWLLKADEGPAPRAGPGSNVAPIGKTAQALNTLEDMKRGLAPKRIADGFPEAPLLELGTHAGR